MTAYEKALSLLAMREHTKKELKEKLRNKGFKDNEIEDALAELMDAHILPSGDEKVFMPELLFVIAEETTGRRKK